MAGELAKWTRKLGGIETFTASDVRWIHEIGQVVEGEAEKGVAAAQKTADEAGKAVTSVQSELTGKQDIGKAVAAIKKGEHLHVHNVKTKRW